MLPEQLGRSPGQGRTGEGRGSWWQPCLLMQGAGCHASIAPSCRCLALPRGLWWVLGSCATLGRAGWCRCESAGACPGAGTPACPMEPILAGGPALLSSLLPFPPPPPPPLPVPLVSGHRCRYLTGSLQVCTEAGWGICGQRGAGCCHEQPLQRWTLPALRLGRAPGALVPGAIPHTRACRARGWEAAGAKPTRVKPYKTATLPAGKDISETCSPCIFAPPKQTAKVKLKFCIWLQDLGTQIPLHS